jgi:hypothetical protein
LGLRLDPVGGGDTLEAYFSLLYNSSKVILFLAFLFEGNVFPDLPSSKVCIYILQQTEACRVFAVGFNVTTIDLWMDGWMARWIKR